MSAHRELEPGASQRAEELTEGKMLVACLDVDYRQDRAVAAGLWFRGFSAAIEEYQAVASFPAVAPYEPGEFYRRELPCLLTVLARGPRPAVIVVDGYVWLDGEKPGLGAHLQAAVGGVVVGVAKTRYASASAVPVYRGASHSPLFVTAAGVEPTRAAEWVVAMHGSYRVPTLLKRVDTLARTTCTDGVPDVTPVAARSQASGDS